MNEPAAIQEDDENSNSSSVKSNKNNNKNPIDMKKSLKESIIEQNSDLTQSIQD